MVFFQILIFAVFMILIDRAQVWEWQQRISSDTAGLLMLGSIIGAMLALAFTIN